MCVSCVPLSDTAAHHRRVPETEAVLTIQKAVGGIRCGQEPIDKLQGYKSAVTMLIITNLTATFFNLNVLQVGPVHMRMATLL